MQKFYLKNNNMANISDKNKRKLAYESIKRMLKNMDLDTREAEIADLAINQCTLEAGFNKAVKKLGEMFC